MLATFGAKVNPVEIDAVMCDDDKKFCIRARGNVYAIDASREDVDKLFEGFFTAEGIVREDFIRLQKWTYAKMTWGDVSRISLDRSVNALGFLQKCTVALSHRNMGLFVWHTKTEAEAGIKFAEILTYIARMSAA